jgi:hypothetical protein
VPEEDIVNSTGVMAHSASTIDNARYEKAQLHAVACQHELRSLFERCDCIITPSCCGEATPDLTAVSNSAFNRISLGRASRLKATPIVVTLR